MPILVLGTAKDPHIQSVRSYLENKGNKTTLIDYREPLSATLTVEDGHWTLRTEEYEWRDCIELLWNREKIKRPAFGRGDEFREKFVIASQWIAFYTSLLDLAGDTVANTPLGRTNCRTKIGESLIAHQSGWKVPRSIVPDDGVTAADAFANLDLILKPLGFPNIPTGDEEGNLRAAMTMMVSRADLRAESRAISTSPHFFQERIEKEFELRVVATRLDACAFRINSQSMEATRVDWRYGTLALQFEPIEIPSDFLEELKQYLIRSGLLYGSFDFIITPEGERVFLECNSEGQWYWIQEQTGVDIAALIGDVLHWRMNEGSKHAQNANTANGVGPLSS